MKTIDERGFAIRLESGIRWCTLHCGVPHLFRWSKLSEQWLPLGKISLSRARRLPRNMTDDQLQRYHDQHLGCGDFAEGVRNE